MQTELLLLNANERTSCPVAFGERLPIFRGGVLDCEMCTIVAPQSLAGGSLQEFMREMLVRLGEDPESRILHRTGDAEFGQA